MISLRLIQDQKVKTLNNSHVVTAGLEIFFLKPWDKTSDGILLTVGHNQSLYLLVSLHQKSFPMVLQFNMAL